MRFATRIIATTGLAFLLGATLRADNAATPGVPAKKGQPANVAATSGAAKWAEATAKPAPPARARAAARPQQHSGQGAMGRSGKRGRRAAESGNSTPKTELFMGYSYWRAVPYSTGNRIQAMNGGSISVAYNFNSHWGLVADFGGFKVNSLQFSASTGTTSSRVVDAEGHVFSALVGPRLSFRNHERFTPFVQVLGGFARADELTVVGCGTAIYACQPLSREDTFALTAGGGLDYRVNHRVALRLFQVEYLMTRFKDPNAVTNSKAFQNNMRLSAGIVFRFGGSPPAPPPNRSPVVTCSADKTVVYAGSEDVVAVHAAASDPDNDPLTYTWTTNGGATEGNGPDVRWNSSGATPGTYTVTVRVADGRGGTANSSVDIRVEKPPNRPPTVSCAADRSVILQGESSGITANGSDPDNDPLTYSYATTRGQIAGSGPKVRFVSTGLPAGRYAIKCSVSDGQGGTAEDTTTVEVKVPPPPPEVHELEQRLALHSIYFPTARPTAENPDGGLVESQAKILVSLASDFKRYLTYRPDAHLILGGHADERGSEEFNQALTQRRVDRTKRFLIEHGVSSTSIETQSFGKEANLNAEQVQQQMQENPDLSPADRQRLLRNLQVIVLANNRRVDVSLSTTGQESVRRYPFNAQDALALISPQGGAKKPVAKKRPAKKQ